MSPCFTNNADGATSTFQWSEKVKNVLGACRKFRISRHGESMYNVSGKLGGNSELSAKGKRYSTKLGQFINALNLENLEVWTSELTRTQQTAKHINGNHKVFSNLNEIQSGDHDSMTYEEIAEQFPEEFAQRDKNKLEYRYPNGESYIDVCRRIEKVLCQIDANENLLIVAHQAVIRCIIAAIQDVDFKQLPYIKVPLHTVMEVDFTGQGVPEIVYTSLNVDAEPTSPSSTSAQNVRTNACANSVSPSKAYAGAVAPIH